jgi:hypothetical protein
LEARRPIASSTHCADVAELADALASGASARKGVEVRVLSSAVQHGRSKSIPQQPVEDVPAHLTVR